MNRMKEIQLEFLIENFREKENIERGYNNLSHLINNNEQILLNWLLRNHNEIPLESDSEEVVYFRDDVDFLIGFYSLVCAAIIAGYIPKSLNQRLISEGNFILGNIFVKRFYTKYYKQHLPQILLNHFLNKGLIEDENISLKNNEINNIFENYLELYRSRLEDKDIDQFLWFLDDGETYFPPLQRKFNIEDLWAIFGNKGLMEDYKFLKSNILKKDINPLDQAILGYSKFLNYIMAYADILKEVDNDKLLQSALWHIESYWFNHLNKPVNKSLLDSLDRMLVLVNHYDVDYNYLKDMDDFNKMEWKQNSNELIVKAKKDIDYLFNSNLGEPLIQAFG